MTDFGPIYNTSMALPAGLGLLLIVALGVQLHRGRSINRVAWAAVFVALGLILTFLGAVMTVTWPLQGFARFDNIAFGEPSLVMGVLLLVGAYLLGARRPWEETGDPPRELSLELGWEHLRRLLVPLSWFGAAMGLALLAIALVGPIYEPWTAPPIEPISGEFADTPWLENWFLAIVYALTGLGAIGLPFALLRERLSSPGPLTMLVAGSWLLSGTVWLLFGAMNYYTHIGLLINDARAALIGLG